MKILDESPDTPPSRTRLPLLGIAVLLVVLAMVGVWLFGGRSTPPPSAPPRAAAPPPPVAASPPVEPTAAPPSPAPPPVRRAPKAKATPSPEEPAAPVLTLKVDSDVPGTDVFVDRVYLGKTPLTSSDVKPGSHVLNASAEGYEGQALPIDVNTGANEVTVRFRVVRLNEAVQVVHKHAIGSCEGRLVADPHGLRYVTTNKDHGFDLPFSQVKSLDVDYLQKNLKLTRTDGKTFNFTDRSANADALFVFQQKVEATRKKLAAGTPPANR